MTNIGVFSSVHGGQIMEYCKWDDQKAVDAFDGFKPDVVCGEVRQSDIDSCEKHYPIEYDRYIFNYCKSRGIPFVPCDYWTEKEVQLQQQEGNNLEAKATANPEIEKQWNAVVQELMEAGLKSSIPFNSVECNDLARRKHELQEELSQETHKITWVERNRRIVENIRKAIEENHGKNILVIFGAEHSYWFVDEFSKDDNLRVTFPL